MIVKNLNEQDNLQFIQQQILEKKRSRQEFEMREKRYYKPHFGPEETQSRVQAEVERDICLKQHVSEELKYQMHMNFTRSG